MIYWGQIEAASDEIEGLYHKKIWDRDFQYDLLLSFLVAIHCEEIELVKLLMHYDIYLR